jgi:predicted MFS family arabinose efflux permease
MSTPCTTCADALSPPSNTNNTEASTSAWLAVGSIAVGTFSMVTTEFLPIGILTDISTGLKVSEGTAGLMVTIPGVLAAFAGPALIVASGRLDRRTVMLALSALLVASNLLAALAPNFATMLVARLLLGLCIGGFWTFAPGSATQLLPAASQARGMSLVLAGVSAATVMGVPAGAFLSNAFGWRSAFAATGALAAIVLLAQMWLLPALPAARAIRPSDLLAPLMRPVARLGLIVVLFLIAGHFAAYTYLTPLLQQTFGLAPNEVTALLLVYGVTGFVGTLIGGSLVARSVRGTTLLASALLAAAMLLSTMLGGGVVAGSAVVVLWGVGFGLIPVALTGWMLQAMPDAPEAGQAMLVTGFQVAIASGALLGGLVVDSEGISSAMLLSALLVLVATGLVGMLGSRGRRTVTNPGAAAS